MSDQAGYSGTALPAKLGIKAHHRVQLVGAPPGFDLGPLPDDVQVNRRAAKPADVTLVFCPDRATLVQWFAPLKAHLGPASALWVAWPKKAAKFPTDVDEQFVREFGLAGGLVDVKVCAVDQVWSGLKFVYRLSDRAGLSESGGS